MLIFILLAPFLLLTLADVGLTEDYAGRKVPQGPYPDIGAYEHADCGEGVVKPVKKVVISTIKKTVKK